MSEVALRARLRIRANEIVGDYLASKPPMARDVFLDIVHAALFEAAMIGVKEALDGVYKLAGLEEEGKPK